MQSLFSENVPGHLSKAIPTAVFPVPFDKIWFPLLDGIFCISQRDQGVLSKVWNAMFFLVRNSVVGRIFDPSAFWRRVLGTTHMHLSSLLRDFDFHPWLSSFCFGEGSYHTSSMR